MNHGFIAICYFSEILRYERLMYLDIRSMLLTPRML